MASLKVISEFQKLLQAYHSRLFNCVAYEIEDRICRLAFAQCDFIIGAFESAHCDLAFITEKDALPNGKGEIERLYTLLHDYASQEVLLGLDIKFWYAKPDIARFPTRVDTTSSPLVCGRIYVIDDASILAWTGNE
ncbi:MAG: hypothetical protein Q9197_006435 [Variospora fuerteventurae]